MQPYMVVTVLWLLVDTFHSQDISLEDLAEQLPAHQPRYVAYSYCYTHDDGRVSYPLCFIFISPAGCKPELQMMYAGSKLSLVQEGQFTKVTMWFTGDIPRNDERFCNGWLFMAVLWTINMVLLRLFATLPVHPTTLHVHLMLLYYSLMASHFCLMPLQVYLTWKAITTFV